MISFLEHITAKDYRAQELVEKLIMYNQGKKYGQIVFLAGGAGSGKGFAIKNFMQGENFKVRDVDELKLAFQRLDALGKFTTKELMDKYANKLSEKDKSLIQKEIVDKNLSLDTLSLKNPLHVYMLHVLVRATGAKDKTLDLLLQDAEKGRLPNILFDITFKDMDDVNTTIPLLMKAGYETKNIHLTWVLTNYQVAIENNKTRDRVVPEDILLATHKGAAQTVYQLITKQTPKEIDGGIYVVLNNKENTVFIIDPKTGEKYKDRKGEFVVKDFKYLTVKDPGKSVKQEIEIKKQLLTWIKENVPPDTIDTTDLDKL